MKKKLVLCFLSLCYASYAEVKAQDNHTLIKTSSKNNDKACQEGSALDQYLCVSERLSRLEQKMKIELERLIANAKSEWGKEAIIETQGRIRSAQEMWLQYRNNQCNQNYYSLASIHPPSESLRVSYQTQYLLVL